MIDKTQILPLILITIMTGAGVVYAIYHDVKMALYFLIGAALNTVVTFM